MEQYNRLKRTEVVLNKNIKDILLQVRKLDTQLFIGLRDIIESSRKNDKFNGQGSTKTKHFRKMNRSMKVNNLLGIQLSVSDDFLKQKL
jgi:hypothetical protein